MTVKINALNSFLTQNPSVLQKLGKMFAVRRQRIVLASLSEEQLQDIGISAGARDEECARKFWDIDF